jgi:hypothetical protein
MFLIFFILAIIGTLFVLFLGNVFPSVDFESCNQVFAGIVFLVLTLLMFLK